MQILTAKSLQKNYCIQFIYLFRSYAKLIFSLYYFFIACVSIFISISSFGQSERIGIIDFYGNRKISEQDLRRALPFREGDTLNKTFSDKLIASYLKSIPGVHEVNINLICCDEHGKTILYAGISETDSFDIKYRKAPVSHIFLPKDFTRHYEEFMKQMMLAVEKGDAGEDDSQGHSFMLYPPARAIQEKFIVYASTHLKLLQKVLRTSSYPNQRATAAYIIAYVADKKKIFADLLYAILDPDETVRNNAARAIGVIAAYANAHPEKNIKIPAEPFIKMINSIIWTDRNKGLFVLSSLTEKRNPELLKKIKLQAFNSLIEMAKWKNRSHTMMSFIILGRLAGMKEDEIFEKWKTIHSSEQIDKLFMEKTY